jgi:hypothetical protein
MGLGSSNLEKVVIPYTNSPSTNPTAKICLIILFPKANKKKYINPFIFEDIASAISLT